MAVNKIDPKVIFASEAPAQDTPAVFTNRTVGWGETRKNGGRPTIKQMNAEQQSTDLKILWLNENSVTPYDPTIDYPLDAVTIKDGIFKIFDGSVWEVFLDKTDIGLGNVDNTSDLNKPISTLTQTALDLKADKSYVDNSLPHNNLIDRNSSGAHEAVAILNNSGENQQQINDRGGATWYEKSGGYALNDRVILANGDIVKSDVVNNTTNPNMDSQGWIKEAYEAFGSTGYTYHSKITTNGLDQSAEVQAEFNAVGVLNSIVGGINYSFSRRGIVLATKLIFPSATNINIDFTGTTLKIPNGTNTLDSDQLRFNSLKRAVVYGLDLDGNRDNIPDDPNGDGAWIGRSILLRLGNTCQDCIFVNTKINNALYCGSQWGNNVRNILFKNLEYSNIGEHVFYVSGNGGGLTNGVYFDGVIGGDFGVNPNAALNNHEVAFVKSSNTIGVNDDFQIRNGVFKQTSIIPYATVICTNFDLLRLKLENITVSDKITALIYPRGIAHYCDIDGVYSSETGATRIVYTHSSNSILKRYTAKNVNLATSSQEHMQVFDYVSDSELKNIRTSNPSGVSYGQGKKAVYERCAVLDAVTGLSNIQFDYEFKCCNFLKADVAAGSGVIDNLGVTTWADNAVVTFDDCKILNAVASSYSIVTNNNNSRLRLTNMQDVIRPLFNRAGTTMKFLEVDGAKFPYSGNPLSGVSPSLSILRGVFGYDGTQLRNFLKYKGQIIVANGVTSNSLDLSAVLAVPTLQVQDIRVNPAFQLGTNGVSSYVVSVSGKTVTITTNATTTAACTFYLSVDVSS